MRHLLLIGVMLVALVTPSRADDGNGVVYVDAGKVAEVFAKAGALGAGPGYTASVLRRTSAGQVELHRKGSDVFYILDGDATFVTGGTIVGGKDTAPDELRGTSITGGETHHLKKGDFISIPAGTPHWFKEVPQSINYYMVKVIVP